MLQPSHIYLRVWVAPIQLGCHLRVWMALIQLGDTQPLKTLFFFFFFQESPFAKRTWQALLMIRVTLFLKIGEFSPSFSYIPFLPFFGEFLFRCPLIKLSGEIWWCGLHMRTNWCLFFLIYFKTIYSIKYKLWNNTVGWSMGKRPY